MKPYKSSLLILGMVTVVLISLFAVLLTGGWAVGKVVEMGNRIKSFPSSILSLATR